MARNSCIFLPLIRSFFVKAAESSRENRYRLMFNLARQNEGLVLILNDIPDDILHLMVQWHNEAAETANTQNLPHFGR